MAEIRGVADGGALSGPAVRTGDPLAQAVERAVPNHGDDIETGSRREAKRRMILGSAGPANTGVDAAIAHESVPRTVLVADTGSQQHLIFAVRLCGKDGDP